MKLLTGRDLFEACSKVGAVKEVRGWEGQRWHDEPGKTGWIRITPPLSSEEKQVWDQAAALLNAALQYRTAAA